jgi:hypothetical protein
MSRQNMIFLALGAFITAASPLAAPHAQSGDALAHAERTCLDYGVGPNTISFETCVGRAATAYDRGEPGLAVAEARRVSDARQACMAYDIDPMTLGYRQCVANEANRSATRISYVPISR